MDLLQGAKHCDDYIGDPSNPMCLRWFLFVERLPAVEKMMCYANGVKPKLFANHAGKRVRVVMASRLGDVGITGNLAAENGYSARVPVSELCNFGDSK